MANNDVFAPPTKQELEQASLFAAPTKEELGQTSGSPPSLYDFIKDPTAAREASSAYYKTHPNELVQGDTPLAIPAAAAPAGLLKAAEFIGKNPLTRTAGGAIQGAGTQVISNLQHDQPITENIGQSAALGAGLNAAGEVISGIPKALRFGGEKLSRLTSPQAEAYIEDPSAVNEMGKQLKDQLRTPELENSAVEAINKSRAALKAKGLGEAKQLSGLLADKAVTVNASDLEGISPEIDALLATRAPTTSEYTRPKEIELSADVANKIKRYLQKMAEFQPGTIVDPVQAARNSELAQKAAQVRMGIESAGGPEVSALNKSMQEGLLLQEALRKGGKTNPLAYISSEAPGRVAALARAEKLGAGGLLDFGNKLGAAKEIIASDVGSGVPAFAGKLLGLGMLRSAAPTSYLTSPLGIPMANPAGRQFLLNQIIDHSTIPGKNGQ